MEFKRRTLNQIADMICGNFPAEESFFIYRSSAYLTEFFEDVDREEFVHDGSTRKYWVAERLAEILGEPQPTANVPPDTFAPVIAWLMDQEDARNEGEQRPGALALLNASLAREGYEAFYGPDKSCYLRHVAANTIATAGRTRTVRSLQPSMNVATSWPPTSTVRRKTGSSRRFCFLCSANWATRASRHRATRTRHWSTARTSGCSTRCPLSTGCISASR